MKNNKFALIAFALYLSFAFLSCGSNEDDEVPVDDEIRGKVASFVISGNSITKVLDHGNTNAFYTNSANQMELWNFFANLIPSDLRPELVKLELFADDTDDTGAYVSPINTNDLTRWDIGFNMAYVWSSTQQFQKSETAYNSIHEFAHVLTLNSGQLIVGGTENDCTTFFPGEGCSNETSYINQFFNNYWTDIYDESQLFDEDDDAAFFAFYDKYADRFVTEYASTNPGEDIAECFARFVLLNSPSGNQIKDQKIRFFYDFQELVAMRDRIRANINFQFDINQVGEARLDNYLFRRSQLN
jgi:hypothetical protein